MADTLRSNDYSAAYTLKNLKEEKTMVSAGILFILLEANNQKLYISVMQSKKVGCLTCHLPGPKKFGLTR